MAIIGAAWARLAGEAAELEVSANQDGEREGGTAELAGLAEIAESGAVGGEQRTENREQRTENREQRTENGSAQFGADVGCSPLVARAKRYQMSQAGTVQRKRFEEILTKQISMSVARMRRARAARTLRERVA